VTGGVVVVVVMVVTGRVGGVAVFAALGVRGAARSQAQPSRCWREGRVASVCGVV
jgi:hypothetical protein